eukprot:4108237-Lingulodinium_polyedra.AAC.1
MLLRGAMLVIVPALNSHVRVARAEVRVTCLLWDPLTRWRREVAAEPIERDPIAKASGLAPEEPVAQAVGPEP